MIQDAPTCSDPARILLQALPSSFPVAFISDPRQIRPLNRYSILSAFPVATISSDRPQGGIFLNTASGMGESVEFMTLREAVDASLALLGPAEPDSPIPWEQSGAPFTGGLAGTLDYEYGGHFEHMPGRKLESPMPPLDFRLYGAVYIMDHAEDRAWWVKRSGKGASPLIRKQLEDSFARLRTWIETAIDSAPPIQEAMPDARPGFSTGDDWRHGWEASLGADAYRNAIERIKRYLVEGDIYQANLTVRYRRSAIADPRDLFWRLIEENPSPFSAFIASPQGAVMSSSPELLLDLSREGLIETRPIKGTVASPRGISDVETRVHSEAAGGRLLQSAKDRAEHLMIVDLERNDLGRVCRTGSIRVDPLFSVEKYEGLQHLVSSVRGQLRPGLGPCDALAALFPGGSITGAPKIRAMEIIHELEPVARGVYTGSVGWITPEGEARMNLAIRTLRQHAGFLDLHVGGGIVIDSDPDAEFEECRLKGEAMARAVARAPQITAETGSPL